MYLHIYCICPPRGPVADRCSRPGRLLPAGPVAPGRPIGQASQAPPQAGTPMAAPAPPPTPSHPIPSHPTHPINPACRCSPRKQRALQLPIPPPFEPAQPARLSIPQPAAHGPLLCRARPQSVPTLSPTPPRARWLSVALNELASCWRKEGARNNGPRG